MQVKLKNASKAFVYHGKVWVSDCQGFSPFTTISTRRYPKWKITKATGYCLKKTQQPHTTEIKAINNLPYTGR